MNANDKNSLGYGTQMDEMSNKFETDSENSLSIFDGRSSDDEHKAVPPPIIGNFLTPRADISFAGLDEYAIRNKIIESQTTELNNKTSETTGKTNDANTKKPKSVSESVVSNPKINRNSVIIEDWTSDDEEEVSGVQKVRPENQIVKTRDDKSGQNSHKQGVGFRKVKGCFVCRSTEHLIKDCNFHDKKSQESNLKNVVNTGVSTRTGLLRPSINTARSVCKARPSVNTARPISTARPVSTARLSINTARLVSTVRPSISTARPNVSIARLSMSTTRPVNGTRPTYPRVQNMTAAGTRAAVNTDNGSFMLKKGNLKIMLQDHAVVGSGCSSHMTGNKAYLSDYKDFNGGFMAFRSDPKGGKITGKENQDNMDAGTQDSYVAGSSGKDKGPTQEYILLPLQPHRTRIPVKDVVQDAQEKPFENASSDKDVQDSEDDADKEEQHQMQDNEKDLQDELEMLVTQELVAKAINDISRQASEEEKRRIASQTKAAQATSTNQLSTDRPSVSTDRLFLSTDRPSVSTDRPFVSTNRSFVSTDRPNTPNVNAASTSTGANADESSFVYLGGKIPIDASTLPNADLPIDPRGKI
ncbi:hypothetical protein Tco_0931004 [Tanacetum coccineum]